MTVLIFDFIELHGASNEGKSFMLPKQEIIIDDRELQLENALFPIDAIYVWIFMNFKHLQL